MELLIVFFLYRSSDITYDEIKEKMDLFNLMIEKEDQKRRDAINIKITGIDGNSRNE